MIKTRKYIIDSGAFTADKAKNAKPLSVRQYVKYLQEHDGLFDYCFNLDVIGDGKKSYENWLYIRDAGINVLPVYHLGTDEKWLRRYMRKTDYIGLGAIANLATKQRVWGLTNIWKKYLTDNEGFPTYKVHGLGLTAFDILLKFPWFSVDSASANIAAAFGMIYLPDLLRRNPDYFNMKSIKVSDQGSHVRGTKSFFSQPPLIRRIYTRYVKENAYNVGSIENMRVREKRTISLRRKPPVELDLGFGKKSEKGTELTLANDYGTRLFWNHLMWNKMAERLPSYKRKLLEKPIPTFNDTPDKTTVYIVVTSSNKYMKPLLDYYPPFNLLVSYYYINNKLVQTLIDNKVRDYDKKVK